jgi:glycosyltransferase involved in cell wall biosynthesis
MNEIYAIVQEFRGEQPNLTNGGFAHYPSNLRKSIFENFRYEEASKLILKGDEIARSNFVSTSSKVMLHLQNRLFGASSISRITKLQSLLGEYDKSKKTVVYHKMNPFSPPSLEFEYLAKNYNICLITTIVDFQDLLFPEFFAPEERLIRKRSYEINVKAACGLMVISRFLENDVRRWFIGNNGKVFYTPLGVDHIKVDSVSEKRALPSHIEVPYVLFPSKDWKHKGHIGILEQIERGNWPDSLGLVMVGDVTKNSNLHKRVSNLKNVCHLGLVTDSEIKLLYEKCFAVILPSLHEGFGLPYLEAGIYRKPIIGFENKSTLEIFGKSEFFVPSNDFLSIVNSLRLVLENPEVYSRSVGISAQRAKAFTWRETARTTLHAYSSFMKL